MENATQPQPRASSGVLRYGWPAPTGLALILSGYCVHHFLGKWAFLSSHFWFEIGLIISLLASVVYAIRLGGKGRTLAPRWVWVINLCFGPLIIGFTIISGLISILTGND